MGHVLLRCAQPMAEPFLTSWVEAIGQVNNMSYLLIPQIFTFNIPEPWQLRANHNPLMISVCVSLSLIAATADCRNNVGTAEPASLRRALEVAGDPESPLQQTR